MECAGEDNNWNVVNLYFVAVDYRRQLRKMEKIVLLKMIFKQTTFVTKSQYFFVHAAYCCCFSLLALIYIVHVGQQIHQKRQTCKEGGIL